MRTYLIEQFHSEVLADTAGTARPCSSRALRYALPFMAGPFINNLHNTLLYAEKENHLCDGSPGCRYEPV